MSDENGLQSVKIDLTEMQKPGLCAVHGEFTNRGLMGGRIWRGCPECAKVHEQERAQQELAIEALKKKTDWERKMRIACIPDRYQDRTFDSFHASTKGQAEALQISQTFADDFPKLKGKGLIFCGLPGTGKTHLANAICLHVMEHHKETAVFTTVQKAIRRIKETWGKKSEESEAEAISAFVYPALLVLDEIGVQFGSDTEKQLLFDILNERYEQRKSTILLSNLAVKEVIGFIGERIFDRLKEDGGQSVIFNWKSHRGQNADSGSAQ